MLFIVLEISLVFSIENELTHPDFNDSAGTAFIGVFPIGAAVIFLFCLSIRVTIWLFNYIKGTSINS